MFRDETYFHTLSEITNPYISHIIDILAGEISDIDFKIRNTEPKKFLKEGISLKDEIVGLKKEIVSLKDEIQQIKKALEYLGVEYKNGVFIVKEQPKKKFLGLF